MNSGSLIELSCKSNRKFNQFRHDNNTKTSLLTELIRPVEFYLAVNEQSDKLSCSSFEANDASLVVNLSGMTRYLEWGMCNELA